jgi:hypothetical protein
MVAATALAVVAVLATAAQASAFDEGTIHSLTDQSRAANGLGPLTLNASLSQVAAGWAAELAARGTLGHNPNYSSQIPGGWSKAAENVAQGYPSGAAVHEGWMASAGHRANILGDFTAIGIAHISAGGTTWSVEVFAKYGATVPPPAAPAPAPAPAPPAPAPPAEPPPPEAEPSPSLSAPPVHSPSPSPSTGRTDDGGSRDGTVAEAVPPGNAPPGLTTKLILGTALLISVAVAVVGTWVGSRR